jgi:hypothetical protein
VRWRGAGVKPAARAISIGVLGGVGDRGMVISGPDVGVMEGSKGADVGNAPKMNSGDHSASGSPGTSANPSVLVVSEPVASEALVASEGIPLLSKVLSKRPSIDAVKERKFLSLTKNPCASAFRRGKSSTRRR